jgi:hypothetical protein
MIVHMSNKPLSKKTQRPAKKIKALHFICFAFGVIRWDWAVSEIPQWGL